jgi:hypothetical protein
VAHPADSPAAVTAIAAIAPANSPPLKTERDTIWRAQRVADVSEDILLFSH